MKSVITPKMVPTKSGRYIPAAKMDAALWLARRYVERDLGRYGDASEARYREFFDRHRMKYEEGLSESRLYDRLARKLARRKKDQLYAIFFNEWERSQKPTMTVPDITEVGPIVQELEAEEQLSLFDE